MVSIIVTGLSLVVDTLQLVVAVREDDATLASRDVKATIDYGDGTATVAIEKVSVAALPSNQTAALSLVHRYPVGGTYQLTISATNYKVPVPDTSLYTYFIDTRTPQDVLAKSNVLFGPIIPKDSGYPNAEQWNFHAGVDEEILAAEVKAMLLTRRGERLMEPGLGSNVHRNVFGPDTPATDSQLRDDIAQDIASLPYVTLRELDIARTASREVTLNLLLVNNLSRQPLAMSLKL